MFDLYGLARVSDFPGYAQASKLTDPLKKVAALEAALKQDINFPRFVPYIQLHEFESLLLVDPMVLKSWFVDQAKAVVALAQEISASGCPPELINEGEMTKPSARIGKHLLGYPGSKVTAGPDVAREIGLDRLMNACPHFGAWVKSLERLNAIPSP